jgi:SAM-dependent methyltransferase
LLSTLKKVTFVDIRPIIVDLPNFECVKGSILDMPYSTDSIPSLSCLHVTEHIGLGRYGDPIDPQGSFKATQELKRVLAPGGSLYFSLPIGKPRICFNAHRVHSASQILQYFEGLELVDHACITDQITVIEKPDIAFMDSMTFGCGMFHFRKPLPA